MLRFGLISDLISLQLINQTVQINDSVMEKEGKT